jgi:hypothetical protein
VAQASSHAEAMAEAVSREEWDRSWPSLIAMTGDRDLAEECAQDTSTRALQARDRDGAPAPSRDLAHHGSPQPGCRRAANGHGDARHAQPLTPAREAINATAAR